LEVSVSGRWPPCRGERPENVYFFHGAQFLRTIAAMCKVTCVDTMAGDLFEQMMRANTELTEPFVAGVGNRGS